MRILVTGCRGLLGTDLMQRLDQNDTVKGVDIDDFDISDLNSALSYILDYRPDIILNCAAYTNADGCESDIETSYKVNALGPRNLAIACNEIDAALLHISTDYIFDGIKGSAYKEDDTPNPLNIYGKTKLAGEEYLRSMCNKYYIVRTQWLFGKHGKNFVKTMLTLAKERNELRVVNDQIGSPTYTPDLAAAITELIKTKAYGTYHVTNSGTVSWFEFTNEILKVAGICGVKVIPITTEELNRPALRPKYAPLDNFNWRINGYSPLRSYKEALKDYLNDYITAERGMKLA